MLKRATRSLFAVLVIATFAGGLFASDYIFLDARYVKLTRQVIKEADAAAPAHLPDADPLSTKFLAARSGLETKLEEVTRARALKKLKSDMVAETEDKEFSNHLNTFKAGLAYMADKAETDPEKLFPSYLKWLQVEAAIVKTGYEERLAAYQTRFGPESEPLNAVEFVISQKWLAGDESGPDAWEPILRVTPVQFTSQGDGLTSSAQLGMNFYFVDGPAPKPLQWIGAGNHIGVAAAVQYLDDPGIFNAKGRPSFGLIFHLDRKEAGVMWDNDEDRLRVTLGYAFQFLPFVF